MLLTLLYFMLALFLLITVHEYGHFLVARWCGVKVLRFSLGFGKVLASWKDKRGTEYAWSAIPLGGYVKMLDESEGEVLPQDRPLAFNHQALWKRTAIVLAGPFFNFIFAFFMLWLVLVIGIRSLAPIVAEVKPGSIAAQAGVKAKQEIIAIDGSNIVNWRDFQYAFMPLVGTNDSVDIKVKSLKDNSIHSITLSLTNWKMDETKPDLLNSLGIIPFIPSIPPRVGEVLKDSPAEKAGFMPGDLLIRVNQTPIEDWLEVVDFVKQHPDQQITLVITRQGQEKTILAQVGKKINKGKPEGFLGMTSQRIDWPEHWLRVQRESPTRALNTAFFQTLHLTKASFALIGRLITGQLTWGSVSGPIGIAQGAGESGRSGVTYYLSFLALVSISLGVLNVLPIPLLDGGHLLYYLIEAIRRRPLSTEFKSVGIYIGLLLLVAVMVVALRNDLTRLLS